MVEGSAKPLVTITGISGFVGAHVCLLFLKDGSYRVRGTVRSKTNPAKIDPLKKAFGEHFNSLELAEADLTNEESLASAIEGSTFVVHTASPFSMSAKEEDLVKPAVDGTMAVVRACKTHDVKRCVITSSVAACRMGFTMDDPDRPADSVFTEKHWTKPETAGHPYLKSKMLAEKAAWDF